MYSRKLVNIPRFWKTSSIRSFQQSSISLSSKLQYKKWSDLDVPQKQKFIINFTDLYKEKHPCSKSNVMYRSLSNGMEEHGDTPYVFGILYNEIRLTALGESQDNVKGSGLMGDSDFINLLNN